MGARELCVLNNCDLNSLSLELLPSSKAQRGLFLSGPSTRMTPFQEGLPDACQVPTFSFQLSTSLLPMRPSRIAAERNPNCACSLLSLSFVRSLAFIHCHCLNPSGFILLTGSLRGAFTEPNRERASPGEPYGDEQRNRCACSKNPGASFSLPWPSATGCVPRGPRGGDGDDDHALKARTVRAFPANQG